MPEFKKQRENEIYWGGKGGDELHAFHRLFFSLKQELISALFQGEGLFIVSKAVITSPLLRKKVEM